MHDKLEKIETELYFKVLYLHLPGLRKAMTNLSG
jgi:hypothetical protein